MAWYDSIGNFFGNIFNLGGNSPTGGYDIAGDHSSVPNSMIDGSYRPTSPAGPGVYLDASSQLIRAWESRGWACDDGFIAELQAIDREGKKVAANSGKARKLLKSITRSETTISKNATASILTTAQGTAKQYRHNEKLLTGLDNVAANMAVTRATRDLEIAKAREQKRLRLERRRQSIRGNSSMGLPHPRTVAPVRFGQRTN
ncbi:hypothetical protein [Lyngbya sp. CCY1209]|uniref:hypothetical protein n=1 Tax=Lyngbya sp. CCY1209 TaxID=2886103 RepID=UPI002D20437F|nr:hypothetical protein [Lyngbya sp. CCY1209]MEB3886146.1 hypothetical protein [Lyngbya sp. CCY1209]